MASVLKNIDIIGDIWRILFGIRVGLNSATPYFDDISAKLEEYKQVLNKSNVSNASTETDDAEDILYWKNYQAKHILAYEVVGTIEQNPDDREFAELASPMLNGSATNVYQSESNGYNIISNANISEINPVNDKLTNLIVSIQKYNTDIIANMNVGADVIRVNNLIAEAYASAIISEEDKKTLLIYIDELDILTDELHIDEHGIFDGQAYLEELISSVITTYDNSQKALNVFSDDELNKFTILFTTLRNNDASLPPELKQYSTIYNDTTTDITTLITDKSEEISAMFYQLDIVLVPPIVQDAWEEITLGESDIIHSWAGNEPESINGISNLLDSLINSDYSVLPTNVANALDSIDKIGLQEAINDRDFAKISEYSTPELVTTLTEVQSAGSKSDIPISMLGNLSTLSDNAAGSLANLVNMPDMNGVSFMLQDLVGLNNTGQILDPQLSNIISNFPSNITDLDLNDLTSILGVDTNLYDMFNRLEVMQKFTDLKNLIPTTALDALGNLPPGMSNLVNSLGDLTGMNGALSELSNLINLGQITGPMQTMLDSVLGSVNVDSLVDILNSENLQSITGIADNLSGLVNGLSELSDLPFKALNALQGIPDKVGDIVDSIGGLIDSINLDSLMEMTMNLGSTLMGMIPAEAAKLVDFTQQIINRIGLELPSLSDLFGPSKLGEAVPRQWY